MTPDEIDIQIHELENRIDRLRALYEQYFMGFERTEPAVPRKDVDRRIHDLRKERFNNTAKRFKFQTLIQRYNTMQQYWGRICREIENGTYKRHKLKAERTVGALDDAFFDETRKATAPLEDSVAQENRGQKARDAANLALEAAELLDANADLDTELQKALGGVETAAKPTLAASGLLAKLGKRSGEENSAATLPGAPRPKAAAPVALPPLAPKRPNPAAEAQAPEAPPPRPAATSPSAPTQAGARPAGSPEPRIPSWRPVALTEDSSKPRPKTPSPSRPDAAAVVVRPTVPVTHESSRPPAPNPEATRVPPAPRAPAPRPTPLGALSAAPPRPAPRPPARPESKRPPPREVPAPLTDERIRAIHEGYQKARAQTNATPVSLEKLAKSLRDTEAQLIAKSNGRKVDFEVVVEAGRAMLKPKLE